MTQPSDRDNPNVRDHPGARLRKAREQRNLGIAEAARRLRLPRTTLEDIEADRMDRIASIYRRGYIVNYARLVDLDPDSLLADLGPDEPAPLRSVLPVMPRGQRFDRFLKFATYALVTTVIVPPLVYFFVLGGARLFEGEMTAGPADNEASSTPEAQPAGYRERFADVLAVTPAGVGEADGEPLSASALPVSLRRPEEPVPSPGAVSAEDEEAAVPAADETAWLELTLTDDSWVEIESADGERLEFDLLRAGQDKTYQGRPPFRVLLGRGSAVEVSLDGRRVRFDGDDSAGVAEFLLGEQPDGGDPAADAPDPRSTSG